MLPVDISYHQVVARCRAPAEATPDKIGAAGTAGHRLFNEYEPDSTGKDGLSLGRAGNPGRARAKVVRQFEVMDYHVTLDHAS
jgi:hypothetical protein